MIEIIFSTQELVDIIKPVDVNVVDKIVVVASSNTEKIEEFLKRQNVKYEVITVKEDFEDIATKIARYIAKNKGGEEFLVNLINVQPLFVVASLSAFLLTKTDAEIVFSYYSIRVKEILPVKINKKHIKILRVLGEQQQLTLPEISEKTGLPLATLWRRLNDLINEEIATKDYKLTRKGRLVKVIVDN